MRGGYLGDNLMSGYKSMNWTTEKPTEPGLYWYRTASRGQIEIDKVNVDFFNFGDGAVLAADIKAEIFPVATLSGDWKEVLHQFPARTTLGWTKEKPTEPGWYWVWLPQWELWRTEINPCMATVYRNGAGQPLKAELHNCPFDYHPVSIYCSKIDAYWLGPIKVPEGPNEEVN